MHRLANPKRFQALAKPLIWVLSVLGFAALLVGCVAGLFLSPPDYLQGETVRIMYVHVPAAWLGMAGWSVIAACSISVLVWRHPLAAIAARAAAVPGAFFTILCLVTGSIWGRPAWGTWWEWDGRLTSMLILFFVYVAYIALSQSMRSNVASTRMLAIFGVIGTINLPIIHGSVIWWNSLHQPPSITTGGSAIAGPILWPLAVTLTGFTALFAAIILMRMRAILAETKTESRLRRMAEG